MTERTFPCDLWILEPQFKPKQLTFDRVESWLGTNYFYSGDRGYKAKDVYETKGEAVRSGYALVGEMNKRILKVQTLRDKRLASLKKAEA